MERNLNGPSALARNKKFIKYFDRMSQGKERSRKNETNEEIEAFSSEQ
jgi:hypothetical protein